MRTAFFIDGYNFFYGLLNNTQYKWLDLPALLSHVAHVQDPSYQPVSFHYFTSPVQPKLATRGNKSKEAQDAYIRALKARNVFIVQGRHNVGKAKAPRFVDKNTPPSRLDQVDIWKLEEKETDVNIAISMYRTVSKQAGLPEELRIQQIILVSGDTDMGPALKAIREDFSYMKIGVIIPRKEKSSRELFGSLSNYSHWVRKSITELELQEHQFPDSVPTKKKPARKPDYW